MPTPRRLARPAVALPAVLAVAVAGAALAGTGPAPGGGSPTVPGGRDADPVALATFGSCDALLGWFRSTAARRVGPYGLDGDLPRVYAEGGALGGAPAGAERAAAAPAAAGTDAAGTDGAGTGTNVQVAGVDEGDLATVVAGRLYSVADGTLRVVDVTRDKPRLLGTLALTDVAASQLVVLGDRALVVGARPWAGGPAVDVVPGTVGRPALPGGPGVVPGGPADDGLTTRLLEVDVSDPRRPAVADTLDVGGVPVGLRVADGTARLALSADRPALPFVLPADDSARARERAAAANRAVVAGSSVADWLPRSRHGSADPRPLVDCSDVAVPRTDSGLGTLTLLTVDLAGAGLAQWDSAAVVASGATTYATADATYVSTSAWSPPTVPQGAPDAVGTGTGTTQVHRFTGGTDAAPRWVASGEVPGHLFSQYAMDEHDGVLRVATTSAAATTDGTVSQVTTLRRDGDRLVRVGQVGGLGRGEQIRSVRFLGDVGYVVTFRQTDPFYTLDLSDPARPRLVGELKIPGYSAYLHPAGDGLVLGVGQDADAQGRTTGVQMALFDVRRPQAPRRVAQVRLPDAWSSVEGDPHAFALVDGLALVPFESWKDVSSAGRVATTHDAGVLAVRVGAGTLSPATVLRPVADGPARLDLSDGKEVVVEPVVTQAPLRTYVVDGRVVTLASGGVATHDATTLRRLAWTAFPPAR